MCVGACTFGSRHPALHTAPEDSPWAWSPHASSTHASQISILTRRIPRKAALIFMRTMCSQTSHQPPSNPLAAPPATPLVVSRSSSWVVLERGFALCPLFVAAGDQLFNTFHRILELVVAVLVLFVFLSSGDASEHGCPVAAHRLLHKFDARRGCCGLIQPPAGTWSDTTHGG